ncbi:hypothetical protein, partial [Amycolatopsis solani]
VARAAPAPARTGMQSGVGNAATSRILGTTGTSAAALLGEAPETAGNSAVATSLTGSPPAAANAGGGSGVGAWFGRKFRAAGRFLTDQGWSLLERVAPELVPILRQGVGNWLRDQLAGAMQSLFAVLTAPVRALDSAVGALKLFFAGLVGWMRTGVAKIVSTSCVVLSGAADRVTHVVDGIDTAETGVLGKLKDLASGAGKFLGGLWDRLGAPVADLLGRAGSAAWARIQQVAQWLWDKTQPIRDTAAAAWGWLKDVIGIGDGPDGRNGIIQWVQARAQDAWNWLKAKLGPIATPLKIAGGVLLLLSPAGPFLAAGAAAYGVLKGARWLWENLSEPESLVRMRKALVNDILPPLIEGVGTVAGKLKDGANWLGGVLTTAWQDLRKLAGALSAPILGPLRELVDWLGQQAAGLLDWVNRNVLPLSDLVATGLTHLRRLGTLLLTVLKKVISVVANPFGIVGLIEGAAWRALPSCMRRPILRFLLTIVKGALRLMPVTLLGPLGAVIREALIGFVDRALENESLANLEQLANRFAKIATEGSWDFTVGYGLGILKGVWDGISGPFILLWDIAKLIGNAIAWLAKTVVHGLPPALRELVVAIRATWETIAKDIWPAVRTFFAGPIDVRRIIQLVRGVMDQVARAARAAGAQVFDSVVKFLRQPDRKLGESIGYVTGVVVFEVTLIVLTAGGYAAKPIIQRVAALFTKAATRITELLSALGSLLPRISRILRTVREFAADNAALKRIVAGVEWIFQKFLAYLRMSYGVGRGGQGTAEAAAARGGQEVVRNVATSLEEVRRVFLRGTRVNIDADLANSFLRAADRAMAEERIALYAGTLEQKKAALTALLRRHAPAGYDVEARVTALLERLEREGIAGLYDPVTNTIIVRGNRTAASIAATLAHELTHQLQHARVGLGTMRKIDIEFQAFYLQKLFLQSLDLPLHRIPENYRWLVNADFAAIRKYVEDAYKPRAGGSPYFKNLEESAAWILKKLKEL